MTDATPAGKTAAAGTGTPASARAARPPATGAAPLPAGVQAGVPVDVQPDAQPVPENLARSGRFARWNLEPGAAQDDESWLVTYLDVITLLLVMMVVMLAFSGSLKSTFKDAMKATPDPAAVAGAPPPLAVPDTAEADSTEPAAPPPDPLAGLPIDLLGKDIKVVVDKGTVSFRISDEILFSSGEAGLIGAGDDVLDKLLPVLNAAPTHRIVVEGHTDSIPIETDRFPSNWELSSGRAASVVRYLIERGIDPARLRVTGYADTRPLASNDDADTRAANRRVELTLEAPKPDEAPPAGAAQQTTPVVPPAEQ